MSLDTACRLKFCGFGGWSNWLGRPDLKAYARMHGTKFSDTHDGTCSNFGLGTEGGDRAGGGGGAGTELSQAELNQTKRKMYVGKLNKQEVSAPKLETLQYYWCRS